MKDSFKERFEIVRELGKGGMGVVYLARQKSLDRLVAVKELLPENDCDERIIQRFHREAKILREIDHPHIALLLDFELDRSGGYLVFEYIEGGATLADRLAARSLDWDSTLAIMLGLADALGFLHSRDIIHRDVKPPNILIGPHGEAKLIDLGLGRAVKETDTRLTREGQSLGTLAYMSPEQLVGGDVGKPSDVYSFGLVAYELIAGRLVFSSDAEAAVYATARLNGKLRPISEFRPTVPPALERLLEQLLLVDETKRPVDMRVVREELLNIVEREELGKLPQTQQLLLPKANRGAPAPKPAPTARATGRMKPVVPPVGTRSGIHTVRAASQPSVIRRAMPWLAFLVAVLLPAVYLAGLRQGQSASRAQAPASPPTVPLATIGTAPHSDAHGAEEAARLREALERNGSALSLSWLTQFANAHKRVMKKQPGTVGAALKDHLATVGILEPLEQFLLVASAYFTAEAVPARERWALRYLLCDLEILEEFCAVHAIPLPWGDTSVSRVFPGYDDPVDFANTSFFETARSWVRASDKPANKWFPTTPWEETWMLPAAQPNERLLVWFSLARWKPGVLLDVRLDRRVRRIIRYLAPVSDPPPIPVRAVEYLLFDKVKQDVTIKLTEALRFPRAYAGRWFPSEGVGGQTHMKVAIVDLPLRGVGADDPSVVDRVVSLVPNTAASNAASGK